MSNTIWDMLHIFIKNFVVDKYVVCEHNDTLSKDRSQNRGGGG